MTNEQILPAKRLKLTPMRLVRATFSSTCAAMGGPDKPGHHDPEHFYDADNTLIYRPRIACCLRLPPSPCTRHPPTLIPHGKRHRAIEAFIARWQGREGGQERANYSMFLTELCRTLGLPVPDPAGATTEDNDYVFERMVKDFLPDGSAASRRIDLYKRGSFVLEAKQSRLKGQAKAPSYQPGLFPDTQPERPGIRTATAGWDVLMQQRPQPGRGLRSGVTGGPWLAAVHPGLRRRPCDGGLCRLLRPGKELRAIPRPPIVPYLFGRPPPPRDSGKAGRHLDRAAVAGPGQGLRPSHKVDRGTIGSGVEVVGATGQRP